MCFFSPPAAVSPEMLIKNANSGTHKRATGEPIKHFREIQRLLTTIYCPKEVSVMHCKGYSRDGSKVAEGNQLVDFQARKAAL